MFDTGARAVHVALSGDSRRKNTPLVLQSVTSIDVRYVVHAADLQVPVVVRREINHIVRVSVWRLLELNSSRADRETWQHDEQQ